MKKVLLTLFISVSALFAFAQTSNSDKLSIGADVGLPTGQASTIYGHTEGLTLKLELPLNTPNLKFVATAGYSSFLVKSIYSTAYNSASYIPLQVGVRYYIIPQFYFEGDAGASINVNSNYSAQRIGLLYAPILGFNLPVSNRSAIDVGFRYEGRVESAGTISQVALRLAYAFNW